MSNNSSINSLIQHTSRFRLIALLISAFSLVFLGFMLFIAEERVSNPEMFSVFYIGVIIGAIQIPLSIYLWKYIPQRIPRKPSEQIIISGFRMTMIIALLLCLGVVLFAGLAAVITGYPYPSAILGGIALGTMLYHWPGLNRYNDFTKYLHS